MVRKRVARIGLLATLLLALGAVVFAGCGGGDDGEAEGETPAATTDAATTEETTTEEATTEAATTEETTTEEADGGVAGADVQAGAQIFANNPCGDCHTLEAAGTSGTIGPNLDETQPTLEEAVEQITNGGGAMPAFGDTLSEQEIRNVAAYVVESTSG